MFIVTCNGLYTFDVFFINTEPVQTLCMIGIFRK